MKSYVVMAYHPEVDVIGVFRTLRKAKRIGLSVRVASHIEVMRGTDNLGYYYKYNGEFNKANVMMDFKSRKHELYVALTQRFAHK